MSKESKEILTTKEAADVLDVKASTIHKYVNEGKLKPVYDENWQIDATKLFYTKDIENLKKEFAKPGLTTGDAAELLGLHITTISQYINKGLLKAEKKLYKGRTINFIDPEEIERFKSNHELNREKDFYDKETGFAWFQSFVDPQGNWCGRILLGEDNEPYLFTEHGRITLQNIVEEGYSPLSSIPNIDYVSKKGYAKFTFRESEIFYSIIEILYKNLGPKNMKVNINEDKSINVEIKPIFIKEDISCELVKELNISLLEGNIIPRLNGVFIDSDLDIITVTVPSGLKELIKEEAERKKQTIEEVVQAILKDKFSF